MIMGAGVAIKQSKLCFTSAPVATRHALRGLPSELVDAIGYVADSDEFADAILPDASINNGAGTAGAPHRALAAPGAVLRTPRARDGGMPTSSRGTRGWVCLRLD